MPGPRSSRKRDASLLDDDLDDAAGQKGSVVRVRLKNFMTYTEVVMEAAPYLNLIVAPNGCGKSALVCGMIIGLAGDVSLTGRSGNLSEYVKFGCSSGTVEIELKATNSRQDYRIHRKLNITTRPDGGRSCRSEWLLNGKSVPEKEVKAFVRSLNIAIDNLCQCLPQERVVEFVKMNSKQLLQNTEKAVGDVSLLEDHVLLIGLSEDVKRMEEEKEKLSGKTQEKEKQNEREEEEIKRLQEKRQAKEEIKSLELKKPWVEFEDVRIAFTKAKEECEALARKKRKEEKLVQPYYLKTEECQINVRNAEKAVSKLQKEIDTSVSACKKGVTKVHQSVKRSDELVQEFKSRVSENSNRQAQILTLKAKIRDLENNLNNKESEHDEESLERKISDLEDRMSDEASSLSELENSREALAANISRVTDSLKRSQCRLQNLDVENRRQQHLRQFNQPAYNGLEVLKEMMQSHAFKQTVYPPMMMVIDVANPQMAKFVESCIPKRDLFAFFFEDDDDLRAFSREIHSRSIRCALIRAPPPASRTPPSINALKRMGFQNLVLDLLSAPEPVKDYLCSQHNLDKIPVGDEAAAGRSNECDKMGIRSFFAGTSRYTMSKSRYDGRVVTTSQSVQDAKILTISADAASIEQVKQEIKRLEEKSVEAGNEMKQVIERIKSKEVSKERIREEIKRCTFTLRDIQKDKTSLHMKRQELQAKESNTFDEEAARVTLKAQLRSESAASAKASRDLLDLNKLVLEKTELKWLESCALMSAREHLAIVQTHTERAGARLKLLEEEAAQKEEQRNQLKSRAKDLRRIAMEKVVSEGYAMENGELPRRLRTLFEKLPEQSQELNARLSALYLKVQNMDGVESESAVQDFENRKREIAESRKQLQKLSADLERKQTEMATAKERWLRPLKDLMIRIDENFSKAMKDMGHAGDVQLRGEGNEFKDYGIVIRVKYRDSEDLQELSAYHQSGGERSVATVIYMMSLQELTKVPFRCIDEINQGMDSANERKVFDLIVETAMKNSSQYFLLSPKLLLGLNYSDKMQIHCIQNGPAVSNSFLQKL